MEECKVLRNGQKIAGDVYVADTFLTRLKGLLFKKEMNEDKGLLIRPCSQVHTIGMKFNIDVVFLSNSGEVVHTEIDMEPGSVSPHIKFSNQILELKGGTIRKLSITRGQQMTLEPIEKTQ